MKFHEYHSLYDEAKKLTHKARQIKQLEFYNKIEAELLKELPNTKHLKNHVVSYLKRTISEKNWVVCQRPYYNVWPILLEASAKLDLTKIRKSDVKFPEKSIAIRFSDIRTKHTPYIINNGERAYLETMMIGMFEHEGHTILATQMFYRSGLELIDSTMFHTLTLTNNEYFEYQEAEIRDASASEQENTVEVPKNMGSNVLQIVVMLGIISNNPDLITPDYIKSDIPKVTEQTAEHYHNRAKKAGKYGWNVGEILHKDESSPHFRIPHLALYWTGEGKQIPKIILRTGPNNGPIPVSRDKITTIPTGYHDKELQCQ